MTRGLGYLPDVEDGRDLILGAPRSLPRAASLRSHLRGIYDQGPTNSCVAQALATALDVEQRARGVAAEPLSRLWLYWWARRVGSVPGDTGSRIRDMVRALRDLGCPPESEWPFKSEWIAQGPAWKLHRHAHDFRGVRRYRRALTPDDVRAAIVAGAPVVAGWQVDRAFLADRGPTEVREFSGPAVGGHAMCVIGFDGPWFDVVNSWGTSWRDRGTCRFHEDLIGKASDAWAIDTNS